MTKRRKPQTDAPHAQHNPVAKFAHCFNKAQIFRDKRAYRRYAKHQQQVDYSWVHAVCA
jgi:hypothetical protein